MSFDCFSIYLFTVFIYFSCKNVCPEKQPLASICGTSAGLQWSRAETEIESNIVGYSNRNVRIPLDPDSIVLLQFHL